MTSDFLPTAKRILIVDDNADIRLALSMLLLEHNYAVFEADAVDNIEQRINEVEPDLVLLDMNFSLDTTSGQEGLQALPKIVSCQIPVVLMTAWGSVDLAVQGMQLGAADFIEKPWDKHRLLQIIEKHIELKQLVQQNTTMRQIIAEQHSNTDGPKWVAESEVMKTLDRIVSQVAGSDASILITGDNGTGKSMLAQRIHQMSHRQSNPFVSLNMGSVPETLFESELFGHKKGAFTDAKINRVGRFELAEKGTLFLDEIGTLPNTLQPKLLRVLESGEYEILGSSQTRNANVRIISATNADLQASVDNGTFRRDLLFRLNTLVLTLPPLRERQADIIILAEHFLTIYSKQYKKPAMTISDEAKSVLKSYAWPGNLRELRQVIERAVLLNSDDKITRHALMLPTSEVAQETRESSSNSSVQTLDEVEKRAIIKALETCGNNIAQAASLLDISRGALYRRLDKYTINYDL
jgi:DNA-binding NtrC family response regulator